jgi:hypothetical protein
VACQSLGGEGELVVILYLLFDLCYKKKKKKRKKRKKESGSRMGVSKPLFKNELTFLCKLMSIPESKTTQ